MANNKKRFADDLNRVGNRRVAKAIIEGRQPVHTRPKKHGGNIRGKHTDVLPVEEQRAKHTDIIPVENIRGKDTGTKHVVTAREKRSKRVELLVTPSTFDRLKSEAARAGESINETINQIIDIYFTNGGGK